MAQQDNLTQSDASDQAATEEVATRPGSPRWFYSFIPNKLGVGATINLPPLFITEVLGGNVAAVGIASALTSAATVPAATFWGWLSDHFFRRRFYLLMGFLGFSIPTILSGFSTSVWQYYLLAALLGAWSAAGTPVSSTLIMDTVRKDDWDVTFGRFNAISGWGVVAGRTLGLICITYGIALLGNETTQRGIWLISGGLSLISVFWAWHAVPVLNMPKPRPPRRDAPEVVAHTGFTLVERVRFLPQSLYYLPSWRPRAWQRLARRVTLGTLTRLPRQIGHALGNVAVLAHDPLIVYYFVSFFLFTVVTMSYTPFPVWQRQVLLNSSSTVFLVGMINSIASASTYRWVGRLIKRYGSLRVQMVTVGLRVVVFGGFALLSLSDVRGWPSVAILMMLQALSGLGWAGIAVAGNTTVAHLAPKGSEGSAVGAYTSVVSVGAIIGAFISGYLVLWIGYTAVFVAGALGVGVTAGLLMFVRRNAPAEAREHL
jgi:MFS family permease